MAMTVWHRPVPNYSEVEFVLVWPDINTEYFWFMNVSKDLFSLGMGRQLVADSNLSNLGFRVIWQGG